MNLFYRSLRIAIEITTFLQSFAANHMQLILSQTIASTCSF